MLARKFIVIPLRHHPNRDNIQVFSDSLEEFQYQDCRTHDSQEVYHAPSERLVKLRYYENKIVHFLRAALLKHWASSLIFYWCKIFGFMTLIKEMSLLWHKSRRSVNWCQLVSIDRCYTVTTEKISRLQDSYDDVGDRCWNHVGVKSEMSPLCHQYFKIFSTLSRQHRDVTRISGPETL